MAKPWEVAAQGGQSAPWVRASENAARREAAPAKAREAFERSRNSPESVAARERAAQHPVRQYLGEVGGGIASAFRNLYDRPLDPSRIPERAVGTLEGLTSALTGAASIVPGAVDLAATNLFPDPRNPEQSLLTAMEKYTYSPRTETGQDFNEALGAVFKPLGDLLSPDVVGSAAADYGADPETAQQLGDKLGPLLGTIPVGAAAPQAARAAAAVGRRVAPKTAELLAQEVPELPGPKLPRAATEPSEVARAADIKIPPSAKPGAKGTALESTVGSTQAQAKASLRNQPTINRHAAAELGLKGEQKFSEQTFRNLEKPQHAVYDEVRNSVPALVIDEQLAAAIDGIGKAQRDNPLLEVGPAVTKLQERLAEQAGTLKTADVMAAVRDWRFKARKLYQSIDDPAKHEQAAAFQSAADSFENAIERQAAAGGKGDLGQRFRDARKSLAKIHDYESAMVDGNIDISVLTKMKEAGAPLSGRAAMLADIGRWFGPETQQGSMVRIPSERMPPWWRTALGRAVQVIGRRPVDELLFSERYQRQFGDVDPSPGPGSPLGAYFDSPAPVAPVPRRAGPEGSGSVDFSGSPNVPPAAALRPGQRIEFARDEAGDAAIPAAESRIGDLTASEVPPLEGIPFEGTDLVPEGLLTLAEDVGSFPGARVPEEAALTEFVTDQPIERRRSVGRDIGEGERRADILRGRQRDFTLADDLLADPRMRAAVEADSAANRSRLNPGDDLPQGGIAAGATRGPLASDMVDFEQSPVRNLTDEDLLALEVAPAEFATPVTPQGKVVRLSDARARREAAQVDEVGDLIEPEGMFETPQVRDASIQATIDMLTELGFTPQEIQIILSRGRE